MGCANAFAGIALLLGITRCHITWNKIAKTGIFVFQVIVAFLFWNRCRRPGVTGFFGYPYSAVIAQTFAHQGQFGLITAMNRNAGGVDLDKTWIGKTCSLFMRPPGCSDI